MKNKIVGYIHLECDYPITDADFYEGESLEAVAEQACVFVMQQAGNELSVVNTKVTWRRVGEDG